MSDKYKIERYENKLREIPAPGGAGCHNFLLSVADYGIMAEIDENTLFRDIKQNIPKGSRTIEDREITSAIAAACRRYKDGASTHIDLPKPKPIPSTDGKQRFDRLVDESRGAQDVDLWEASPYRIECEYGKDDAIITLGELYKPDEVLFVGPTGERNVYTVADHINAINKAGSVGPHIIPNPMSGELGKTNDGKESYRCDATVIDYRFALVEFDDKSKEDQLAFWYSMIKRQAFDIAYIMDSGGKSLHAWIRVNLKSREAWDASVKGYLYDKQSGRMAIMGADTNCKNPSRLSRIAGHYRKEKKAWQRLLYLNP
jgi:hypothetical protein